MKCRLLATTLALALSAVPAAAQVSHRYSERHGDRRVESGAARRDHHRGRTGHRPTARHRLRRARRLPAAQSRARHATPCRSELVGLRHRSRSRASSCWSASRRRCRLTLGVATLQESVTVSGESPARRSRGRRRSRCNVDRRQMESLPLQGRNWMSLSMLVKGITANDVSTSPGVGRDELFQLNLDGQQVTQKLGPGALRPAEVQSRIDRRVPARDAALRHHAGTFHRRPGAGRDASRAPTASSGSRFRLLPRRQAERRRPRRRTSPAVFESAGRRCRSAARSCATSSTTSPRTNTSANRRPPSRRRRSCPGRRSRSRARTPITPISRRGDYQTTQGHFSARWTRSSLRQRRSRTRPAIVIRRRRACRRRTRPTCSARGRGSGEQRGERDSRRLQRLLVRQPESAGARRRRPTTASPASRSARPTNQPNIFYQDTYQVPR